MTILFLTPDLQTLGGVQFSGQIALAGLRAVGPTHVLAYGPGARQNRTADTILVGSQAAAIRAALAMQAKPQRILVWHIGLLKLRPFVRTLTPTYLFLHGIEAWRRHDPLTLQMLTQVDHFLSNSDYTWQRFLDYYPHLRDHPHATVQLGLEAPHPPLAHPVAPPAVLILGRMARAEDYKGHRELITAWSLVRRVLPTAQLWIAGDGDLRSELEAVAQAQNLPPDVIHFFGRISEAQKTDLLAGCRCLAMPSRGEGFGLVYLEAMRLGRPCLVSAADAGREVVAPPLAGLAADPQDRSALATALIRLLSPGPQWEAWSAQARSRYETCFTAAHFQERLVDALGILNRL